MNPDLAYDFESMTVGDLAAGLPGAAAILRAEGLAFHRRSAQTLAEAAAEGGLDGRAIAARLAELERDGVPAPNPTPALIDHIVATYHEGHRRAFATLIPLARGLGRGEGADGLADLLEDLRDELEDHMVKEEERLFPMMRQGGSSLIGGPIAQMRAEHAAQRDALMAIERLTQDPGGAPDADDGRRRLRADARALAAALVEHMWLENEVLFPRFEGARRAGPAGGAPI
jgi:regulator of cell morphogenesis and NO signaling